jgi:hypothetical protein
MAETVYGPGQNGGLNRVREQLAEGGLDAWVDRAQEVRNDAQDFWPPHGNGSNQEDN